MAGNLGGCLASRCLVLWVYIGEPYGGLRATALHDRWCTGHARCIEEVNVLPSQGSLIAIEGLSVAAQRPCAVSSGEN